MYLWRWGKGQRLLNLFSIGSNNLSKYVFCNILLYRLKRCQYYNLYNQMGYFIIFSVELYHSGEFLLASD